MQSVRRTFLYTGFLLLEYFRSARILAESVAAVAFFVIFLRRSGQSIDAAYFFTVSGIFTVALMIYTMSILLGMADRPQGYVLLARHIGRAGYLLGIFNCALVIVGAMYGLICIATAFYNPPVGLTFSGWLLGTLPLGLNVALMAALLLMLSPLVFSSGWRLFVLGLIALAFSSNFVTGTLRAALPDAVQRILATAQTVLSWPLVPAFSGFALATTRDYSGAAFVILIAQASLLMALLTLAVYAFIQRDLIFHG